LSRRPLIEKLRDQEYLDSLSERRRKEILFCSQLLSTQELSHLSSIAVAYNIARRKYIEENIREEEREDYLVKRKPIFYKEVSK